MSEPAGQERPETFQRLDQCASRPYTLGEYLRRYAWEWVYVLLVRLSPRRAHGWRRFWLRRFGAVMADTSYTKKTTIVRHPWLLEMGEHTTLSEGVEVYNLGPIRLGDHTVVSQDAYLCAGTHDYADPALPLLRPTITIGNGVWICAGAFIGPGVTIGDNAVVGARAVVMKDVEPGVVVAGNPAVFVRERPMGEHPDTVAGPVEPRREQETQPARG